MKFIDNRESITQTFIQQHISTHLGITGNKANVLDVGCDNYAIDFGDIIVRFPSNQEAWSRLQFESAVCGQINVPDLQTSKTKTVSAEYPFSWHKKIKGDYFLSADYEGLTEMQKEAVAQQLAEFFKIVHALPQKEMEKLGARNLPPYISHQTMHNNSYVIPADLTSHFNNFMESYKGLSVTEKDRTFGYFDAHSWNMAFDRASSKLVGLYDFADCGLGDVHQDFHPLNTISQDLVQRVIKHYQIGTGKNIDLSRVNFYTILAEYSDLFEISAGNQTLMEKDAEHHFRQLRRWKKELKVYI